MLLLQESFHGGIGETSDESPSLDRFGGDGVFLHAVEAIVMQTSYSDGHFVEGTKAVFLELTTKGQTSLWEEFDVGDTIVHEIPLHVHRECPRRPRGMTKMWHMLEKLSSLIFPPEILHDELINVVYSFCSDLLLFSRKFAKTVQDANR